jgi:hypothetical protein
MYATGSRAEPDDAGNGRRCLVEAQAHDRRRSAHVVNRHRHTAQLVPGLKALNHGSPNRAKADCRGVDRIGTACRVGTVLDQHFKVARTHDADQDRLEFGCLPLSLQRKFQGFHESSDCYG